MKQTPIRILQVVPNISPSSGVFRVVLNWHRYLDTSKVQFDYIYFKPFDRNCLKEIESLGGKCTFLPYKKPWKLISGLVQYFKQNPYTIIHSHVLQLPLFIFPIAKRYGVKHIIQHAHASKLSDNKLRALRNYLMLHTVWPLIDKRIACSELAGKNFFKKNFTVIKNGIEVEKFAYNPQVRSSKRKELGIEDNFVLGHIGRLSPEKNHIFLLKVFAEVAKRNLNARLVLVGGGPLEKQIKRHAADLHVENKVLFLGPRSDVPELLQAMDVFCLPSLFEGFGLVAVEAQTAGLPCVLADTLPKEVSVCNYKTLPLGSAEEWAKEILLYAKNFKRTDTTAQINAAGFSASEIAQKIQDFYMGLEE